MNVLHFSTFDGVARGAASAAYQLHLSFRSAGHQSKMIVRTKSGSDNDVQSVARTKWQYIDRAKNRLRPLRVLKPNAVFNIDDVKDLDTKQFIAEEPGNVDLICLHSITGFLTSRQINRVFDHYQRPLLWILMDQEPVTGGCHYSYDCDGFANRCGNCPQLLAPSPLDLSHTIWSRKIKYLQRMPIVFIAPSSWAVSKVKQSSIFCDHRVELIPLPIDPAVFRPFNKGAARDLLHLPQDKKVIFVGARYLHEVRKGMAYLMEALQILQATLSGELEPLKEDDIHLLVVGAGNEDLLLPFPSTTVPYLRDELSLALAYQAADVFACPSIEDAGPMMLSESMMCGTPVVAFNTGRAPDLVQSMETGYLANYKDSVDFAQGLYSLLASPNLQDIGAAAHEQSTSVHSPSSVVNCYLALYESLLNKNVHTDN